MTRVLQNLVPSFNIANSGVTDASVFVRPPTLRGLPGDQVLVLVNGKRRHRSALVQLGGGSLSAGSQGPDLSQIPTIAIERIEVLRDGAAAQYGSDAIAGVLNYTLKKREGIQLSARYGQYYKGDGENYQLAGNAGVKLGERGFINISGEYIRANQTSRGGQAIGAHYLAIARPDLVGVIPNPGQINGDPKARSYRFFVNAAYEAGPGEFYAFGNYGVSKQAQDFRYRQSFAVTGAPPQGAGTVTYPATPLFAPIYIDRLPDGTYNAAGRTFSFTSVFPGGFTPRFHADILDMSAVGGYRGETDSGFTYDLSVSYGRSRFKYDIGNTVNPSLGPNSPTQFHVGQLEERERNFNADFTYPLELGLASRVTFSAGAEARRETYIIRQGDEAAYIAGPFTVQQLSDGRTLTQSVGSNGFPGYSPQAATDRSRNSWAIYGGAEADVTKALSVGIAGRHEHFSDFGDQTIGKLTARYEINRALALRGSGSTGFRAPTVGQLYTTNVTTLLQGVNPVESATLPATTAAAQYFGAVSLKPEKSRSFSGGIVLTPGSGWNVTVDYYNIKVNDRIGQSGLIPVQASDRPALQALGVANYATLGQVRFFTNAFDTRTQGVDLVISHNASTDWGRFSTTVAANYNKTRVTARNAGIIDDVRKGDIENLNPKFRASLTEAWSLGRFAAVGRVNYFDKFSDYDTVVNGGKKTYGSEWKFDLELSYELAKHVRVAVGGDNIFDNYPDKNIRSYRLPNSNFYDATGATAGGLIYPEDSNGGFWYVRVAFEI